MKPLPLLNQEEWKRFNAYAKGCPKSKMAARGGQFCDDEGITAYCSPYGCPKWKRTSTL